MRVAVGMSGGVDSSVAALLLKQAGHEVTGVTMLIYSGGPGGETGPGGCYGPGEEEDVRLASGVCRQLGITHQLVDLRADFRALVLDYARDEYLAGRTPNPCVRCNQRLKFGLLPEKLAALGLAFDAFATGHYCRVEWVAERGRFGLRRALDRSKDQSYFLCMLGQEQLRRLMLPVGALAKVRVRELARAAGLPNHDRPESQDFAEGGYRVLLGLPDREGPVVDDEGRRIGSHRGVWGFTVGQRRGLGIGGGKPLYVTRLDARSNTVVASAAGSPHRRDLLVHGINWVAREAPDRPLRLGVMVRSVSREASAVLTPKGPDQAEIRFDEPQAAIAPGQWAVFYKGDLLEGGGTISDFGEPA